jgi:hypothetical protein
MFGVDAALTLREVNAELGVLRWLVGRLEPEAVPLPDAVPMWHAPDTIERLATGAKTCWPPGSTNPAWPAGRATRAPPTT